MECVIEHLRPHSVCPIDRSGFFVGLGNEPDPVVNPATLHEDYERGQRNLALWKKLGNQYTKRNRKAYLSKMRAMVRHSRIHPVSRGYVWMLLSGALQLKASSPPDYYSKLTSVPLKEEINDIILRDLSRTYPTHVFFKDANSVGQQRLHNVLRAYANHHSEVGYCQGMGFIAAVFLMHLSEEDSFWLLLQVMTGRHFNMQLMYVTGFPLLQRFLKQLRLIIRDLLPALDAHMEEENVQPSFYASHWFLTLFAYQFPFPLLVRVIDLFISEGWKIVFRVALCLLQWEEGALLEASMETMLMRLKTIHEGKSTEDIIQRAMAVPIKDFELWNNY